MTAIYVDREGEAEARDTDNAMRNPNRTNNSRVYRAEAEARQAMAEMIAEDIAREKEIEQAYEVMEAMREARGED